MRSVSLYVATLVLIAVGISGAPDTARQNPFTSTSPIASAAALLSSESANPIADSFIVVLKPSADVSSHHTFLYETLAATGSFLSDNADNELKHIYNMPSFRGYAGKFTSSVLDSIRAHPDVEYVERDQVVHALELQRNAPWGLSRISHRESLTFRNFNRYLYDGHGGEGVTAYVVDTGINVNHVDFEGRAKWGITVPENDADADGNGHGTHVAGTITGSRYGVAKKAHVVAVKVLRSNGSGTMADVVKGVEWVAEAHRIAKKEAETSGKKHKGSVANMSLGGGMSKALNAAVNGAVEAGVHFAVAAGNDDADACDYSPASAELAVTVGASTIEDERAWFSNKGPCVDIFAPGKDVTSTWIGGKTATNTISGTSMASPHIAGLLAYLLSLEEGEISTKALKKKLVGLSTKNALQKIPDDTVNLLAFSDPPSQVHDTEELVEERIEQLMEALQGIFKDIRQDKEDLTKAAKDDIEIEWTWL
jgi:cerevisin